MSNGTNEAPKGDALIKPSPMNDAIKNLTGLFERSKSRLAQVAPKHVTPERMIRLLAASLSRTPKLVECDPGTLLVALMTATQLGLEPNTPLGHGYIVPMWNGKSGKNEAQFWPGYKGLILLAEQTGYVTGMRARLVHQRDHFEYSDTHRGEEWSFRPADGDRGEILRGFAVAEKANGGKPHFEQMTLNEILAIRDKSPSSKWKSGPWYDDNGRHFPEMARKTLIKRCAKGLALTPEKDDDSPEVALSPAGRFVRAMAVDDTAAGMVDDMIAGASAAAAALPERTPEVSTTADKPAADASPPADKGTRKERASAKAKEARGDAPPPPPDPAPPSSTPPSTPAAASPAAANDAPPPPPTDDEPPPPPEEEEPTGDRPPTVAEELQIDLTACATLADVRDWYAKKLPGAWPKLSAEERTAMKNAYTAKLAAVTPPK